MALEIERKFVLPHAPGEKHPDPLVRMDPITQVYLVVNERGVIRLRDEGGTTTLTVKGAGTLVREEHEIPITEPGLAELLAQFSIGQLVRKMRLTFSDGAREYVVDVFQDQLKGLVLMEIEFPDERSARAYRLPPWAKGAREVTEDPRYANASLATKGKPVSYSEFAGEYVDYPCPTCGEKWLVRHATFFKCDNCEAETPRAELETSEAENA